MKEAHCVKCAQKEGFRKFGHKLYQILASAGNTFILWTWTVPYADKVYYYENTTYWNKNGKHVAMRLLPFLPKIEYF